MAETDSSDRGDAGAIGAGIGGTVGAFIAVQTSATVVFVPVSGAVGALAGLVGYYAIDRFRNGES